MNAPRTVPAVVDVVDEVLTLGRHYGVARAEVERALVRLAPWLESYAEVVLCEQGFELITGGVGRGLAADLAAAASEFGLPEDAAARFVAAANALDEVMLGLKVPLGRPGQVPTVYARCALPLEAGVDVLGALLDGDAWRASLGMAPLGARHLYGFGLTVDQCGRPVVKTYTLSREADALSSSLPADATSAERSGFLSWRVTAAGVCREHKRYLAEVDLRSLELSEPWRRHLQLAVEELGYEVAGHLGRTFVDGRPEAWKLYVERIGGIPNDEALA